MRKEKDSLPLLIDFYDAESEKGYRSFIRWVMNYADTICLTCDGLDYMEFKTSKWSFLNESVIRYEHTTKSPVTTGPSVLLLYCKIDYVTNRFLKSKTNIYDFRDAEFYKNEYRRLWDLCLMKDEKFFFYSCTHERFCHIEKEALDCYRQATGSPNL